MALDELIVIRHARSGANRGRVQGQSESELARGYKPRVEKLTDAIASEELSTLIQRSVYIFCSDSDRAYYTAQPIHGRLSNKYNVQADLRQTELLRERGQGILERQSFENVAILLSRFLPSGIVITPDAESIYPHLFSNDQITDAEKLERAKVRLEKFVIEDIQQLEGTGLIVCHAISGMNYLTNLLKYGNILGEGVYQNFPNLSRVKLELESFGRYRETGRYEPPNGVGSTNGIRNRRDRQLVDT